MAWPQKAARLAGLAYLVTIVTGLFAELGVRGNVIVSGDAAATARNVMASEGLWRMGFVADLIGGATYLAVTLLLYELLRPVSRSLSLLAAFFSLVGIAIGGGAALAHLAPLFLLNGAPYLRAFDAQQLQALAYLAIRLHAQAYLIALVFFGFYEVLLGYLIFRSTFFPRVLGILVGVAGLAFLTNSFALGLAPAIGNALNGYLLAIDGVGEIALMLWLLVMGVNVRKWDERAYARTAS
jgi:hypothetical protein